MSADVDALAERAVAGDRRALSSLLDEMQHRIFGLAIRMLGNPADAEDATQDILLMVAAKLDTFRGQSSVRTWIHRVAINHLLNARKRSADEERRNFHAFAEEIDAGIAAFATFEAVQIDDVLVSEIRLSCTHAMLVCLDRNERIAFILGAIFELNGEEAASLLDITPAAFRKRLSRARQLLEGFMRDRCGVFHRSNPCRCEGTARVVKGLSLLKPEQYRFTHLPGARSDVAETLELLDVARVMGTQPSYAAPSELLGRIEAILAREH